MITIIKQGGEGYNHGTAHKEFMITSQSDVADLPTNVAPGSIAFTADEALEYMFDQNNTWIKKSS